MRHSTVSASVIGRHRRGSEPGRHRAPVLPSKRGHGAAVVAAALTGAGVLVPGVAVNMPDHAPAMAAIPSVASAAPVPAVVAADARIGESSPQRAAVDVRLKPPPPAKWVDPLPTGSVTSCFGPRWGRPHAGVDIAAPAGTTVTAAGTGQVVTAGATYAGYGISVLVAHPGGVTTHYAHLARTVVAPGDKVTAGDPIGAEGSTGNSTGPHLHFEVRQDGWDNPVEPTSWMRLQGVDLGCAG